MGTKNRDRLCQYDFVVTVLWIGFILAISFMEAPLRFQAEDITIPLALQVGKLVFHGLNYAEIAFAIWVFGCQFKNGRSPKTRRRFLFVLTILIVQTLLLFLILDQRTNAIIAHQEVGKSHYHMSYIGLEAIKLIGLCLLGYSQLQDFKDYLMAID